MRLLIISDLHLSNGDHFGVFTWEPKDFIQIINDTIQKFKIDKVILNGDVFEMYKYRYKHIYLKNAEIIDFFKENDFIFIRGNHDSLYRDSLDDITFYNSKSQLIHIEHGHEADVNGVGVFRWLFRWLHKILRLLTRNKKLLDIYLKAINRREFDIDWHKKNSVRYLEYAIKLLKKSYDVVVLGHAHELRKHKFYYHGKVKHYFCTGTCTINRFQGVVLDTETLEYLMIKSKDQIYETTHPHIS
jgi:predicted phosphodiesterase